MVEFVATSLSSLVKLFGIIVVALVLNIVTQIIYKKFSNQKVLKELNDEIKSIQKTIKEITDSDEKLRLQSRMLGISQEKMKHTMKPMLFSSLIFMVSFPFISKLFKGFTLFVFEKSYPIIGSDVGWLLTYIMVSLVSSMIIRKKMGIHL